MEATQSIPLPLDALLAAGAVDRLAALLHAAGAPRARHDGLGAGLRITRAALAAAALIALARRSIGGSTGDTIGAAVALTEVAVCLSLLGTWR